MLLREALDQGPLAAATLITAQNHVDREITWAQVVDHPDIEPWVSEGHLLLSTGYNWPKDAEGAHAIVERLAAKGVCGVVLAVPHFIDHFPEASVKAALKVGLPLMEIPWAIPFSGITQAIHRELVGQQARDLARSEQIHRELTEAAVSSDGLQQVAQVLGHVLQRDVWILAQDAQVLSCHSLDATEGKTLTTDMLMSIRAARIDSAPHPTRLSFGVEGGVPSTSIVAYGVRVRADCVGYVLVAEGATELSAIDLRAVEHAGTVSALQISHQRALAMQEARLGYALIASLIEGRFDPKPQVLERAQLLGWSVTTEYRLCSLVMDEPNPLSREGFVKREEIAAKLKRSLELQGIVPLISLAANQINVLVPSGLGVDRWWGELELSRAALAVSQPHTGVEGMAAAGREAAELLEHLRPGRVHHYEDMLLPRVLHGDPDARRIFLERMLRKLEHGRRGQDLIETAVVLAQEGFHLQRSATRLNVHISTLRYRLERLSELTGLDLESADGRFQLQLAIRLHLLDGN